MAAVHADAAVFGYAVYSQGVENTPQTDEHRKEEKTTMLLHEPCPCLKEDFIVFAEFSEVTGPVPLLTIPSKLVSYEDVDINTLIMKIMSVDYLANPSGLFAFSKDVQVLQNEVLPGRHAYVHYCTLHDLRARGFVRPLCLAYISADHKKLQDNFAALRQQFLAAAEILKYNNRQTFTEEISLILANLKQIQNRYFLWKKKEEDGECLTPEEHRSMNHTQLDQLAHQHTELHHMLLAAEPLQDSVVIEALLQEWRRALELSCEDECRKFMFRAKQPCVPVASAASVGPSSQREPLRSVPALSPCGMAAMLWQLLSIQRQQSICRLHTLLHMFPHESYEKAQVCFSPAEALADPEYLHLLQSASLPFHWPNTDCSPALSSPPIEVLRPECLDYMEANLVASGNEASSSYHSAPESLSELMIAIRPDDETAMDKRSLSLESFLDVASDSDSCDESLPEEQDGSVLDTWSCCPWNTDLPVGTNVSGRRLLRFFQQYPRAAQHIVHSLLTGRTVVLAGGECVRAKVRGLLIALSAMVPLSPLPVLWWHRGILVSSHVASYRLIGVCVPERLSVHDMMSPRDKNLVTILEVASGRLWGPAYSGKLLNALEVTPAALSSDQALLLLLRSVADGLREKLFVLKMSSTSVSETLSQLDLTGCDAAILKHLLQLKSRVPQNIE